MKDQLIIKMVLDAWNQYLKRTDDLFLQFTDQDLLKQIAPGKNTAKYLLGHLTAVHDRMLPLLGLGQPLHPAIHEDFERRPDGDHVNKYSTADLRRQWSEVNTALNNAMATLTLDQWFERHNAVSPEDFNKEPHRNKLNVIINRTNHVAWHYGQLLLIKNKEE
ncbi:DinB family protein [Chryseolinea sp. H1M3-3]|uniref:DinB family protein n=1 Tax=Chryseolinea sp. H1M3-3 TaxID=3034144 RepID=UPI0023ED9FE5|nr:DinB family protein [Chryseolinea sp. H1M3-3]